MGTKIEAGPALPSGSLLSEAVDELPNWLDSYTYIIMIIKDIFLTGDSKGSYSLSKKVGTIRYGYGNGDLMQECFPKHSRMGTGRGELE